ncbi:DUF2059 domain-containing protein [Bartonella ancashensis]|uniref:DUF2059 domain-containing protein n=1 Tax=Bartonella ancashensis TaxID=1318743 RepID=A0A0M4M6N7_9HYPH|nr:DUF2059 domain-containing protein [Bartonella ancashensis]ALE03879.1 hypothetical protein PU02_1065 [Bartonella ancashensis]
MKNISSFQRVVALFCLVTFLAVNIGVSYAQNVSEQHLEAAKKMIKVIHATDQFDSFLPTAARDLKNELVSSDPNLEAVISDIVDKNALALAKRRADLEKAIAYVYTKYFSLEELDKITVFYSSDVGKKFLTEVPNIARDSYAVFNEWSSSLMEDLVKNVENDMAKTVRLNKLADPKKSFPSKSLK